jgi:replicative DNA helicase
MPASPEIEKIILGAILIKPDCFDAVRGLLEPDDFSTERNRRCYRRMIDLKERGDPIDRVMLMDELQRHGELESVELSYLMELDTDVPEVVETSLATYCRSVKDRSGLRQIIFAARDLAKQALDAVDNPQILVEQATSALQDIASRVQVQQDDGGQTVMQAIESFPGGLTAFLEPSSRKLGLPTGYDRLDDMLGGLHDGELIVIAGRPSTGKSCFMSNIVEHLTIRKRKYPAIFSLEMSAESILTRMMCSAGHVDHQKFRAGYLNKDERYKLQVAVDQLSDVRLRIYDKAGIRAPELISTIRRLARDEGCHAVFIDYLGLIGSHEKTENKNQEVSRLTRDLKLLAMECEIPIVLLCQLSRAPERRGGSFRPILSDLRDSGSIEQDADTVLFIFRSELYNRDREDYKGKAEIIISKQRNGPVGSVPLRFLSHLMRFENASADDEPAS